MNPLFLLAQNLRTYPSLEFAFPDGITAIVGSNGSGKSTLLGAVELALFAGVNVKEPDKTPQPGRDLAPALGSFSERLEIELTFEHDSTVYRVRRGYRAGGSATLDLETRHFANPEQWESITKESAAATQTLLTGILGLSRRTFNASAFLAQGNASAFPEASPSDRKAILGEILDPRSLWPQLAGKASADRKQAEAALAATQARIADREPLAEQVPTAYRNVDRMAIEKGTAEENYRQADEAYEQARAALAANEAAAERYRGAVEAERVAREAASRAQQALGDARQKGHQATETRVRLEALAVHAADIPEFERLLAAHQQAVTERDHAQQAREAATLEHHRQYQRVLELERDHDSTDDRRDNVALQLLHLEQAEDGTQKCDRCQQTLGREGRIAALMSLQAECDALNETLLEKKDAVRAANTLCDELDEKARAIVVPDPPSNTDYPGLLAAARRAQTEHAALQVTLAAHEEAAAQVPALEQKANDAESTVWFFLTATEEARKTQKDPATLEQTTERTRLARSARRVDLDDANQAHTRAQTALQAAQDAASELATLRSDAQTALAQLATYRLAERAYGRDGVPALIAENIVGVIEAEANRVLERLPTSSGTTFRVELRTQRALKGYASALRETLDILVSDRTTTREFLTFSGGERFRVSFALRWALAKLLANRRGAESRLLVIDEPDGLDAGGMDGLAAVLRENADVFSKVLLVSHNPLLASAFEQVVEVVSDGDVSRLVA